MKKYFYLSLLLIICMFISGCKKTYTVVFEYSDGEFILDVSVKKGEKVETPILFTEEGYYYEWSGDLDKLNSVEENLTIVATVKEMPKIVYYYIEGELVKKETTTYFNTVSAPSVPPYYKDYSFIETTELKDNVYYQTYTLSYSKKEVSLTFKDTDGTILESKTLEYGSSYDDYPSSPIVGYYYVWDKAPTKLENIKGDLVVTGTLKECEKVVRYYIDETLKKEHVVKYSESVLAPDFPENTKNQSWVLTKELVNNTYYFTYNLQYEFMGGTISYYDGNKQLSLDPANYLSTEEVDLPTYEKEGYEFIGWFLSDISLYRYDKIEKGSDGNIVFYARFVNISEKEPLVMANCTYEFTNITRNLHSDGVSYVYQPVFPDDAPSKSPIAYTWSTSDSSIATVSKYSSITGKSAGYCILNATLISDPTVIISCVIKVSSDGVTYSTIEEANKTNIFKVKFLDYDGTLLEEQTVIGGTAAVPPHPKEHSGLAFAGWDKEIYNITEDTIINAIYVEGTNPYAGKKFAIIGDSISAYQDFVPSGYSCFYPYPTADVNDINQMWWKQAINKLGGSLFVNNSYAGSCVSTGNSATIYESRLKTLLISNQAPNVIVIFMGSNDCASSYVTEDSFDSAYKLMIEKIQKLCPNAEIILCTLPTTSYYSSANQSAYNAIIEKHANNFGLKVVDFSKVNITNDLVDTAHPYKSGMNKLALQMIEDLLG